MLGEGSWTITPPYQKQYLEEQDKKNSTFDRNKIIKV
jgi:hypothetical protein